MHKIQIIGCGGSGKSTLAVKLGDRLNLEVYHLDRLYWKPDWIPSSREEFTLKLENLFEKDGWIMDGNYGGTMELRISHSDTIIVLDISTWTCLFGALSRFFRYRNGTREDMTEGNEERLDWEFFSWILFYRKNRRPRILTLLEGLQTLAFFPATPRVAYDKVVTRQQSEKIT